MNTRSLAARLKRLEFRSRPRFQHQIELCIVDSKAQTLYRMRLGQPENQYFAPNGKPITKEEAERLASASESADPDPVDS
jgi:hypothetical protein